MADNETESSSEHILDVERSPGSGEKIFVSKNSFKGREYVDIRIYYDASKTDEEDWRPTKKGVTIPPELLPVIIDGLTKAKDLFD